MNKSEATRLPDYITVNEINLTDESDIAKHFNTYFGNIGKNMSECFTDNSNIHFSSYLDNVSDLEFTFHPVTSQHIRDIINGLSSTDTVGADELSSKLIKTIADIIVEPLTIIINQSLITGIVPFKLKIAKVIPIFQKGDLHFTENYRPISILPVLSKVLEKVVYTQVYIRLN